MYHLLFYQENSDNLSRIMLFKLRPLKYVTNILKVLLPQESQNKLVRNRFNETHIAGGGKTSERNSSWTYHHCLCQHRASGTKFY